MSKITLNDLTNLQNENTAVTKINQNNSTIEAAFDNTLSRNGLSPNQMQADFDMNSHDILNVDDIHVNRIIFPEEEIISLPSPAPAGSILYRDPTQHWAVLPPSTSGKFLETHGTFTPTWTALPGGGDMLRSVYDPSDLLADAFGGGVRVSKRTDISSIFFSSGAKYIQTEGSQAVGDLGKSLFKKVNIEPTHPGKEQSLDGAWWEIAEKEIDPIQLQTTPGLDDTVNFQNVVSFANKITLTPNREYILHNVLNINRPLILDLNGATISASAGFTDDNLINITSGGVTILGPGTIDGRNLPKRNSDYIGADFISFTVIANGTTDNRFNNLIFRDVKIIAGDTASISCRYCDNLTIENMFSDGSYTSNIYSTEADIFLNQCMYGEHQHIRMHGVKHKGITFANCSRFNAHDLLARSTAAGDAAIFASGSSYFNIDGINVTGGFGLKIDTGISGKISNVVVDGFGVALGGIMLQGCQEVYVRNGFIRNFTSFGAYCGGHSSKSAISFDCGFDNLQIKGSAVKGDGSCGYFLEGAGAYGCYGTQITGGLVKSTDIGVFSYDAGTAILSLVKISGIIFEDIKTSIWFGPAQSLDFCRNSIQNCTTLDNGIKLWSDSTGEIVTIDNNVVDLAETSSTFLNLVGNVPSTPLVYDVVSFCGNKGKSGLRPLNIDMQTNGAFIRTLIASNNQWYNCAANSAFLFNNSASSIMQVCLTGNSLIKSSAAKSDINFTQSAGSGLFNGVVENNMSGVINKPNNI